MRAEGSAGFVLSADKVRNDIYIPRYYDPRIESSLKQLDKAYALHTLEDLVDKGFIEHAHGKYVPKIYYGTGPYPYVRTSDLSNWEIRASPKHGVSKEVYAEYAPRQDVRAEDLFLVHEGTYLIGSTALVTPYDGPMLYQHHIAKFRVRENAPFDAYYMMVAFGSKIVQRQIRAKQFSADIIDSVVGRLPEVIIPLAPQDEMKRISTAGKSCVLGRASWRERLARYFQELEDALAANDLKRIERAEKWEPQPDVEGRQQAFLGQREPFVAFQWPTKQLKQDVFIPKYYNPTLLERLNQFRPHCDLVTIGELVEDGALSLSTGDEIGRLSYGTGAIPFVRTSDLGSFELKADAKHGVDEAIWREYQRKQNVQPGDILLVRDGTYLVGTSNLIFEADLPLIFCGGIYKISALPSSPIQPALLYGLLNLSITQRQIRSKQFTRDVIDTLGRRISEIILPIPRSEKFRKTIDSFVHQACAQRVSLRGDLSALCDSIFQ